MVRTKYENFTVLINICEVTGKKQKVRRHSMTTAGEAVRKIFMEHGVELYSMR